MIELPNHTQPKYSEASRDNALFHYTTAEGLIGILETGSIWSSAYYCANDESELTAGKGVLEALFRSETFKLIEADDPRLLGFRQRGVRALDYADQFERLIVGMALNVLCPYLTCFCKPTREEDFLHGLLSQWRGYGGSGGYALQLNRAKLLAAIERSNKAHALDYDLEDVHYAAENPLRTKVLDHADAFVHRFNAFLDELAKPLFSNSRSLALLQNLPDAALAALFDYLIYTKNEHFSEERECRLSLIQPVTAKSGLLPVQYFTRNGLLVPYTKTPSTTFNVLDCVEWIVVGPGPRMEARFKSVCHLIKQLGYKIEARPSHIPFAKT